MKAVPRPDADGSNPRVGSDPAGRWGAEAPSGP